MTSRRSELGVRLAIGAALGAAKAVSPLDVTALRRLGVVIGDLAWRLDGRSARVTRTNIDLVYADRDHAWRQRLVRESLRHTAMTLAEAVALWTWPPPRVASLLRSVEGDHRLRPGTLVIAPHFGNWEYIGYYLNTVAPLTALYQRPGSAALDRALATARGRFGTRSAADSIGGLRRIVKALQTGGLVVVLPDQVPGGGAGVMAPCFGQPALTMSLVSGLLQRVDANVVIGAVTRVEGGFSLGFEAAGDAVRDADPAISARAINAAIEAIVARDPAQYQWEYKRFRSAERPGLYK